MRYDLHPKLKQFFEPGHPEEVAAGYLGRDVARAFFEFLQNLVVIGAIKFFSDKTGSTLLHILYNISSVMLLLLVYSFIGQWDLKILRKKSESPGVQLANVILTIFVTIACTYGCILVISIAVNEMAYVQGH